MLRAEFGRPKEISYKGEVDIVTESDKRSEALIVARLRKQFPRSRHRRRRGQRGRGCRREIYLARRSARWHHEFRPWLSLFCVCQSACSKIGEPIVAAIMNPIADELFTAARGEGARLNGKPIHVSPLEKLAESLVCTGFPPKHRRSSANMSYYWEFTLRSHGVRRDGSAALDLCSVACGRFEAFWEFGLNSWDTAAGMLIVTEAGGRVTDFAGRPYRPGDKEMLATNGHIHDEMQRVTAEIAHRSAKT